MKMYGCFGAAIVLLAAVIVIGTVLILRGLT
jgi:hypothetical protein